MKNERSIPQTEIKHEVANVVAKLGFPLFFILQSLSHVVLSALVAGSYTMICYQALVLSCLRNFENSTFTCISFSFLQILNPRIIGATLLL